MCSFISFRRVLIIVSLEVEKPGVEVGVKIGNPINLSELNKPNASGAQVNTAPVNAAAPAASNNVGSPSTRKLAPTARSYQPPPMANLNDSSALLEQRATHPINALSPYQNKWVIKARVTSKSPIRTWSNAKGEGKLFSMDLMDESGQIRVTAFRDQVDKFFEMIEVISRNKIKPIRIE